METMKIGYIAISKASWMTPKIDAIAKRTFENLQTLPAEILYHGVTTTEGKPRPGLKSSPAPALTRS
ncbi:MAG: hypothetical protein L6W00_24605 [Lentisphaeria bacterium]|nr:MAG: hypothetical protein L6W00_24605 [Lentisphaeria bacterium]